MERAIREHLSEEQLKLIRDWSVNLTFQFCALRTPFSVPSISHLHIHGQNDNDKKKDTLLLSSIGICKPFRLSIHYDLGLAYYYIKKKLKTPGPLSITYDDGNNPNGCVLYYS